MNFIKPGQLLFLIAIIAFGIEHFIFGNFVTGRAPEWPLNIPGQQVWAYVSGAVLVLCAIAIFMGMKPRVNALLIGLMIFLWALMRHVPILAADLQWGAELTRAGKALALFGGAFAMAALMPKQESQRKLFNLINQTHSFIILGRYCLGSFMIICGIEHFIFKEFVATLVPAWIPGQMFWTYFTGIALIAGGAGLLLERTARLAGTLSGIMIFLWFIFLHIPRGITFNNQNEWIAVVEALAVSGIAFMVTANLREKTTTSARSYSENTIEVSNTDAAIGERKPV